LKKAAEVVEQARLAEEEKRQKAAMAREAKESEAADSRKKAAEVVAIKEKAAAEKRAKSESKDAKREVTPMSVHHRLFEEIGLGPFFGNDAYDDLYKLHVFHENIFNQGYGSAARIVEVEEMVKKIQKELKGETEKITNSMPEIAKTYLERINPCANIFTCASCGMRSEETVGDFTAVPLSDMALLKFSDDCDYDVNLRKKDQ